MRRITFAGAGAGLLVLSACVAIDPDREAGLTATSREIPDPAVREIRNATAWSESGLRLQRISSLERQAIALIDDAPLRLGPISSAILAASPQSLTGHLAAFRFYAFVESDEADLHKEQAGKIAQAMSLGRSGTEESPYLAHSSAEARAFVIHRGDKPVGALYTFTKEHPLLVKIAVRRPGKSIVYEYFDVSPVLNAVKRMQQHAAAATPDGGRFVPSTLDTLAQLGDITARVTIGEFLAEQGRLSEAVGVFESVLMSDNSIVDLLIARTYQRASEEGEGESRAEALEQAAHHYRQAADSGYDAALLELGQLHLTGALGAETAGEGIELIEQAAVPGNRDAALVLALHLAGGAQVPPDAERAKALLGEALRGLPTAEQRRTVGQLLLPETYAAGLDGEELLNLYSTAERRGFLNALALKWVREAAALDPEMMVLFAKLHARGEHVRQNFRKSGALFRRAARGDTINPELVNDIAWTMAVTHYDRLRNPRFALQIMEPMMNADRRVGSVPAFIDTLAAIHAALGNFEEAVRLQRRALAHAAEQGLPPELLTELQKHLQAFKKGNTVIDPVP